MTVGNRISLPGTDIIIPYLEFRRYRGSEFQNVPFYLHFLAGTSSVKFVCSAGTDTRDFTKDNWSDRVNVYPIFYASKARKTIL